MNELGTTERSATPPNAYWTLVCERYVSLRGDRRAWRAKAHLPHEPLEDDPHPPLRKPQVDRDNPDETPPAPVPPQPPVKDPTPVEPPIDDPAAPQPDDPDPASIEPPIDDPGDPSITPPVQEPPDRADLPRHVALPRIW